jgi:hypothetical protein
VPCYLAYILNNFRLPEEKQDLASKVAKLFTSLRDANQGSGKGLEGLFAFFLMARCIAREPDDYFIPKQWFASSTKVRYNDYNSSKRHFEECTTWEHIEEGIPASTTPTIHVIYPSNAQFQIYDLIVVFSRHNRTEEIYGYQLKEGRLTPKQDTQPAFVKSFAAKGSPPTKSTVASGRKWLIPSGQAINSFLESLANSEHPRHGKRL